MLSDDGRKLCPRCGETKPAEGNFYETVLLRKNGLVRGDGYSGLCKVCTRVAATAWARANPEQKRETDRRKRERWRALHPLQPPVNIDHVEAAQQIQTLRGRFERGKPAACWQEPLEPEEYVGERKRCSNCHLEKPKNNDFFYRNRAQPDGFDNQCKKCGKVSRARYKKKKPDNVRADCALWRERHRAYNKTRIWQWRQKNVGWINEYNRVRGHLRRTLERDLDALTLSQWRGVLTRFEYCCAYCDNPAKAMDHLDPISRGGRHNLGNVVPVCQFCNTQKKDRTLEQFCQIRNLNVASIRTRATFADKD